MDEKPASKGSINLEPRQVTSEKDVVGDIEELEKKDIGAVALSKEFLEAFHIKFKRLEAEFKKLKIKVESQEKQIKLMKDAEFKNRQKIVELEE